MVVLKIKVGSRKREKNAVFLSEQEQIENLRRTKDALKSCAPWIQEIVLPNRLTKEVANYLGETRV